MIMNYSKEIGGYFGLGIEPKFNNILDDAIALNDARSCLMYVIRAFGVKEIYLPYYTCPVVWQSVKKENCKMKFYHIDKNFMPTMEFPKDAYVLYTNYFGVCSKNVRVLAKKYKNLIIDNAQAFYMPKYGIASFNSIRKFFGVSDGAILVSDKILDDIFEQDTSYQRFSHLLKRLDVNAQFGYQDFCKNDDSLVNEGIKIMSNLTTIIFNSIDVEMARLKRLENFAYMDEHLGNSNELKLQLENDDVPMVYPYLNKKEGLRQKLIDSKIYVARYWSAMPEGYVESCFQKYLLPLPIDQRYSEDDMKRIVEKILE